MLLITFSYMTVMFTYRQPTNVTNASAIRAFVHGLISSVRIGDEHD